MNLHTIIMSHLEVIFIVTKFCQLLLSYTFSSAQYWRWHLIGTCKSLLIIDAPTKRTISKYNCTNLLCKRCTVKAPVYGTLNSAISNFQTWLVRTVMEVLKYCWMKETSNMQCNYNSFIQIINFMGLSVMIWGAEKMVPAEYWCPYGKQCW